LNIACHFPPHQKESAHCTLAVPLFSFITSRTVTGDRIATEQTKILTKVFIAL